jgi:parvulin-like peptidyl-prolyl isomerase
MGMVAAFGDVAWRLDVGEFGVAPFDPKDSPYGWHIIQRRE